MTECPDIEFLYDDADSYNAELAGTVTVAFTYYTVINLHVLNTHPVFMSLAAKSRGY